MLKITADISILPQLLLILERMIFKFIYPRVRPNITSVEHDFMTKRSTITQLLEYLDKIYSNNETNLERLSVYFGFCKAFDQVPHHILLSKLANFGFDYTFLELFSSYLSDRPQIVRIQNISSSIGYVTSGVPQGSVLGPLLFVLFINDMPNALLNSDCYLFTDDSKLFSSATHFDIMRDIDLFNQWTIENEMTFNADKCKFICFNSNESETSLCLNDISIPSVSSIKGLGVTIYQNLKWDNHLKLKLIAVNNFFFIKRSIPYSVSLWTKFKYYQLCIRSILLYGSQIWYPSLLYRRKLELFNKKCLKWVTGLSEYAEQLKVINSLPISFSIALYDLVFLNKVLNEKFDFAIYKFINFTFSAKDLRNTAYPRLTATKKCRLFFTEQFFFYRVSRYVNMLYSNDIADFFAYPEAFKKTLKNNLQARVNSFDLKNSYTMFLACNCINYRS